MSVPVIVVRMILAQKHPHPVFYAPVGFAFASLIWLVIGLLVVGGALYIISKFPLAEPIKATINVVVLLATLIVVILWIGRAAGFL